MSDSKRAIEQLQNISFSSNVNPVIIKIVQICNISKLNVKFLWTRGHAGVRGNEKVDALAKQGCVANNEIIATTTITDLRTSIIK